MKKVTVLCVLDGLGLNPKNEGNAVSQAKKPVIDHLLASCPHTTLTTHGQRVGLPEGQMGNSEVGHLNIGAGRVVDQWLLRISKELKEERVNTIASYQNFINNCQTAPAIHLIGLFSDGGVHSHVDHLYLLCEEIQKKYFGKILLHLITDGRDTSPNGAKDYIEQLEAWIATKKQISIASISGRFFAMDRDNRWERVEQAYQALTAQLAPLNIAASNYLSKSYQAGTTDEFIEPAVISKFDFTSEDAVIFWNFRADRMREIVSALCLEDFQRFSRPLGFFAKDRTLQFTNYNPEFKLPYLFETIEIKNFLGEVIANRGLTQLRTAETEKYPHVTYFLNGGSEAICPGEERSMVASPRDVKTYDLKPEMSAVAVKDVVVKAIADGKHDLIVVNFANCDMVGHTGVLTAGIKAVETVDTCLGEIINTLDQIGGQAIIIADHGNAEQMINYDDNSPNTAHTTYPVPFIIYSNKEISELKNDGALCDVAPSLLKLMGIPQPAEMTGQALF